MNYLALINRAVNDKDLESNRVEDVDRARYSYDFGLYNGETLYSVEELIQPDRFRRSPESTPTRVLVLYNTPILSAWAMDQRSLKIQSGVKMMETAMGPMPEEQDAKALMQLEEMIRQTIKPEKLDAYFTQTLLTGLGVVSVGLDDDFFIPRTEDVFFDGEKGDWIMFRRMVKGEVLNRIMEEWESGPSTFMDENLTKTAMKQMKRVAKNMVKGMSDMFEKDEDIDEVMHGQLRIRHVMAADEFYEFLQMDGTTYFHRIEVPVIHCQYFAVDKDGDPIGVHSSVINEEISIMKAQQAIASRINEASGASMIVEGKILNESNADMNDFHKNAIITISDENQISNDAPPRPPVTFIPSRVEEIEYYERHMNRLWEKIYKMTGLYPRPTEFSTGETSASEALMIHQNTTIRHKKIISDFMKIFRDVIRAMAFRDYGVLAHVVEVANPLDFEAQKIGTEQLMPELMGLIESDPTGKLTGGSVNAKTIQMLIRDRMEAAGLDSSYLSEPNKTALSDAESMMAAQGQEQDALDKAADAELRKSIGAIGRARNGAVQLELDTVVHKDLMALEYMKLLNDASERGDKGMMHQIVNAMSTLDTEGKDVKVMIDHAFSVLNQEEAANQVVEEQGEFNV